MINKIFSLGDNARIVKTIEFVPDTLYYTLGRHPWMSGNLMVGGKKIGDSHAYEITPEEKEVLNRIIEEVTKRHHITLQSYGGN